jgi:hypothetical protein
MYEHSSYTSAERILDGAQAHGFDMAGSVGNVPFRFGDASYFQGLAEAQGTQVQVGITDVTVPFSSSYTRRFIYDVRTRRYAVFEGDDPHIDALTGEQLTVENVLVQNVEMYVIAGDDAGRRHVGTVGEGTGMLFTNGMAMPLKWVKPSADEPTQWYDMFDDQLTVSIGKTWINIFSGDALWSAAQDAQEDDV